MIKNNSREFFLLSLIVVGVVVVVVFENIRTSQVKNRDSVRKRDLVKVQNFLENYYTEHKSYPPANFQRELPKDPGSLLNYFYEVSTDRQKYHLLARIENTKDTEYTRGLEGDCRASCTYGITNPGGNVTETLK
ncbi:MAG: hypothetical protein HYW33_02005 [Candidatus Blackburnbacteria bacterium]|nr:hypothetical protein [Candidatus Blackburnbacteria bacterium]